MFLDVLSVVDLLPTGVNAYRPLRRDVDFTILLDDRVFPMFEHELRDK